MCQADGARRVIPGVAIAILAVIMAGFLAGCSPGGGGGAENKAAEKEEVKPLGPSEAKARLDFDERMKQVFWGEASVHTFKLIEREVLSEDRVNLKVRASYRLSDKMRKSFIQKPRGVEAFLAMDGVEDTMTMQYRLKGNGLWEWVK